MQMDNFDNNDNNENSNPNMYWCNTNVKKKIFKNKHAKSSLVSARDN